jgi:hypothetical protein
VQRQGKRPKVHAKQKGSKNFFSTRTLSRPEKMEKNHTVKVQKYNRAKYVSNCGANNVVEHYRKRIKILHGCPFEG